MSTAEKHGPTLKIVATCDGCVWLHSIAYKAMGETCTSSACVHSAVMAEHPHGMDVRGETPAKCPLMRGALLGLKWELDDKLQATESERLKESE